jgi:hypothetical protein
MAIHVSIGQAHALGAADAASKAAYFAMRGMGSQQPVLGFVIATTEFPLDQVCTGASLVLGDVPLFGFSTSALAASTGKAERGVAIALLAGTQLQTRQGWWPGFAEDPRQAAHEMQKALDLANQQECGLFLAAEAFGGDPAGLIAALPKNLPLAGCLAGGDLQSGRTWQLGGKTAGSGGLAATRLEGCKLVVSAQHGWQKVGAFAQVTRSKGLWLRSLDDLPATETFARLFGYPPREWTFPPLNTLVRIYPLEIEIPEKPNSLLRAPIRAEADGSLRMHTAIPEAATAHFMLGSADACLEAARRAAQQALAALDGARPALALLFVDAAWQTLLVSRPGAEVEAVQSVLGTDVPILGGYTFGQIVTGAELLNNHILIALLGE